GPDSHASDEPWHLGDARRYRVALSLPRPRVVAQRRSKEAKAMDHDSDSQLLAKIVRFLDANDPQWRDEGSWRTGGPRAAKIAGKAGRGATLKVGFLENARYPDGTPVAMIGLIQNFGAPGAGIPPRPFFTVNFIERNKATWPGAIAGLMAANQYDVDKALTQ